MVESLVFSAACGVFLFATLLIWQNARTLSHLSGATLVFLVLLALGFLLRAWIHTDAAPLKGLGLGLIFISTQLLPHALKAYACRSSMTLSSNNERVFVALSALGVLAALPMISTAHMGTEYQTAHPISDAYWRWINVSSTLGIGCFLVVSGGILYHTHRALAQKLGPVSSVWFGRIADPSLSTLRLMFWLLVGVWVRDFLSTAHCLILGAPTLWSLTLAVAFISTAVIILNHIMHVNAPAVIDTEKRPTGLAPLGPPGAQYARSGVNDGMLSAIQKKLAHAMYHERVFEDPALSLSTLAHHIGEKTTYVSQCLSQRFHCNFFDLVNRYRVEHAKHMLIEQPERAILDISESVGFQSKSTFYSAFKKATGTTPRAFRQDHVLN